MFKTLRSRVIAVSLGGIAAGLSLVAAAVLLTLPPALEFSQQNLVKEVAAEALRLDGRTGVDEIIGALSQPGVSLFVEASEEESDTLESHTPARLNELIDNDSLIAQSVFLPESDAYVTVAAAKINRSTLSNLVFAVAVPVSIVVFLVVGLALFFSVRRAFLPVEDFADKARRVTKGERGVRLADERQIPEIYSAASAIDTMMESLEESEAEIRRMSSDVVHEMKTPLSTIVTMSENLLRSEDRSEVEETAIGIIREAQRAASIVGDLTAMGDAMSPKPLGMASTTVGDLLAGWPFSFQAPNHKQMNLIAPPETLAVTLTTDARRVQQILTNLITNGLTWAKSKVTLEVYLDVSHINFVVTDDGPGVSFKERDLIFERFYRGDKSRSRSTGGAGLGLSISKAFAMQLGGELHLLSPDDGGHFALRLAR